MLSQKQTTRLQVASRGTSRQGTVALRSLRKCPLRCCPPVNPASSSALASIRGTRTYLCDPCEAEVNMLPDADLITIGDNVAQIRRFLSDLVLRPRRDLANWAEVTKQTPNVRIGYPAQHLASLVTGVEGARTAARGHDLSDHSEVKSCSRLDQLDKCNDCRAAVARIESRCPSCGSTEIKRNNDSKWLLSIKSQQELDFLLQGTPRVVFILSDYPNFDLNDWSTIQIQVFEIWPTEERQSNFARLMTSYFKNIYLPHVELDPGKRPAPKNFWPYSFQFYMCNPVRVFNCIVDDALDDFQIRVLEYVDPAQDRLDIDPVLMPMSTLTAAETQIIETQLGDTAFENAALHGLDWQQRLVLELRDTDHATPQNRPYQRGVR